MKLFGAILLELALDADAQLYDETAILSRGILSLELAESIYKVSVLK
jgi:hypothetical protein